MTKLPKLFVGNFARSLDLRVAKPTGNIKLRTFQKMSGLKSYGTLKFKDGHLVHNIPDITVIEKKKTWFIDVAQCEIRIEEKQL